jgi:hypothetical protein
VRPWQVDDRKKPGKCRAVEEIDEPGVSDRRISFLNGVDVGVRWRRVGEEEFTLGCCSNLEKGPVIHSNDSMLQ